MNTNEAEFSHGLHFSQECFDQNSETVSENSRQFVSIRGWLSLNEVTLA